MFKFTIRDLLWIALIFAIVVSWRVQSQCVSDTHERQLYALKNMVATAETDLWAAQDELKYVWDLGRAGPRPVSLNNWPRLRDPRSIPSPQPSAVASIAMPASVSMFRFSFWEVLLTTFAALLLIGWLSDKCQSAACQEDAPDNQSRGLFAGFLRFQFSIRDALLMTAIIALAAGWWEQRRAMGVQLAESERVLEENAKHNRVWEVRAILLEQELSEKGCVVEWDDHELTIQDKSGFSRYTTDRYPRRLTPEQRDKAFKIMMSGPSRR